VRFLESPTDHFLLVEELEHSFASAHPTLLSLRLIFGGGLKLRIFTLILVVADPSLSWIVAHWREPVLLTGSMQVFEGA
jgi:hypothetical protein